MPIASCACTDAECYTFTYKFHLAFDSKLFSIQACINSNATTGIPYDQ
ncbi:MAG TPA: hypothetical protein DD408_08670 [Rheinheimera sp.]|nr:hypothetical protein [Rheinheimera sp.]